MRYIDLTAIAVDKQLRPYQLNHKKEIYQAWDSGCRSVMLQMPTGTGKTHLFVSIIKDFQTCISQCRVLVLAHRDEILNQICNTLYYKYNVPCGKIDKSNHSVEHNNILVASVQTMVKRLNVYDDNFDLIVVDEAHHTLADSYIKIIRAFSSAKVLGVTATPYRLSGDGFGEEYDKLILSGTIKEYIEQGYLSDIKYLPTDVIIYNCDCIGLGVDGDYKREVLFKHMNNPLIYTSIINAYKRFASNKKGIVYTINQKHNFHLQQYFEREGIPSSAIDSKTPSEERKRIVELFKNGEINVLCNVDIFGEGFDCPDVDFILLARPTKSLSLYLQQVGRGLRKTDNKDSVLIIDCVGSYTRFGLPTKERDWQKHFDGKGKEIDYSPTTNEKQSIGKIREEYGLSVEIKEIQLNEDLSYLKDMFVIESSEQSYEQSFRNSYMWYDPNTIRQWIANIKKIDDYIRDCINSDFTSILYTVDVDLVGLFENTLNRIDSFVRYDTNNRKRLVPALKKYKEFCLGRVQAEENAERRKTQQEDNNLWNDIIVRREGDITKNDIEITLATLCKFAQLKEEYKSESLATYYIEKVQHFLFSFYKSNFAHNNCNTDIESK